ncbi:ATP synthase-associated protein, putative [Hepatocystis sp. ex Piliocolobus tephrosceles]|nr:ATP synthase-associated protein, putative [Hepatocystis sp. ex Piliocolobus tephrosceles]
METMKNLFFIKNNLITNCEEKKTNNKSGNGEQHSVKNLNDAFVDIIKKIPINPFIDSNENLNKYEYGVEKKTTERYTGVQVYDEHDEKDHKKQQPIDYPFPVSKKLIFEKNKVNKADDRININYSNIISDLYPEEGYTGPNKKKHFSSDWELLLAHNHGLYKFKNINSNNYNAIINRDMYTLNTENDIRNNVNLYTDKINVDKPNDPCKYLGIEEYKCLLTHSFHMNTNISNQKCVKWFNEYMQCKWDEHKLNNGYNYIENRRDKKSKAYIAAPDYQYS